MRHLLAAFLGLLFFSFSPIQAQNPTARFKTNLGDIDVELLAGDAPKTVANFLNYAGRGDYNNSFFHRSVAGFIIQGGGFRWVNNAPGSISQDPPVVNEYKISNTRGTLAMAKLGTSPNSATNQWFFNLGDNSANLNNQNGGFTVFGRVTNAEGLAVMDRIAAVPVPGGLPEPYDAMPLINYAGGTVTEANLVTVTSVTVLDAAPSIRDRGIISAGGFGGFPSAAPGSFIEIFGAFLAGEMSRTWNDADFSADGRAPTSLDDVSVTIAGERAFVYFISPIQINVQVPANVPTGGTVPVVVTYKGKPSAEATLAMRPIVAGLLAPASFNVLGRQYVVAQHQNGTFVGNGRISGVPSAPASRSETITLYGVGFGPVSPSSVPVAGQVVRGLTSLAASLQFNFRVAGTQTEGQAPGPPGPAFPAQTSFAGLAPGLIGLYQFNVIVPSGSPVGDVLLEAVVNGEPLPQRLFIPVQN